MTRIRNIAVALQIDETYPHHQAVFAGVRRFAQENTLWRCVIEEHPGYAVSSRGKSLGSYDGVIARVSPAMQRRLDKAGIPHVNTWYQTSSPDAPGVYVDVAQNGKVAAEHLIDRGFKRFASFDFKAFRQGKDIADAFEQRVKADGYSCIRSQYDDGNFRDRKYWMGLTKSLISFLDQLTPPIAVFTIYPWLARLMMEMSEDRNWDVPHDISFVCLFDVQDMVNLSPTITCIDNNFERVGYEAAAYLERLMTGSSKTNKPILIPPKGVIPRETTDFFAVEDQLVADALRFISAHMAEQLSVERIARKVLTSPRSLQRRFEAALGRPISDEIRRLRLTKAKRLLGEKNLQVKAVAQETGFNSSIIMNQVFQRELGMSPGEYRKQMLGE